MNKKIQVGLILLTIVLIVVVLIVMRNSLNLSDVPTDLPIGVPASTESETQPQAVHNSNIKLNGEMIEVTGRIMEMMQLSGIEDKRIVLSVQNDLGEMEEYKFFFSKEQTKGIDSASAGEMVTVSFTGSLSTQDYVLVKTVAPAQGVE